MKKPPGRFELPTPGLQDQCSNPWATRALVRAGNEIYSLLKAMKLWLCIFTRVYHFVVAQGKNYLESTFTQVSISCLIFQKDGQIEENAFALRLNSNLFWDMFLQLILKCLFSANKKLTYKKRNAEINLTHKKTL